MKKGIVIGLILAVLGYVLSIASEATQDSAVITSYVTGGFELIFYLISIPLIYHTGKKIRKESKKEDETRNYHSISGPIILGTLLF